MKLASLFLLSAAVWGQDFILRNVTIHPVVGPEIKNGAITVAGGKITEVSAKVTPKKTDKVIDGKKRLSALIVKLGGDPVHREEATAHFAKTGQ